MQPKHSAIVAGLTLALSRLAPFPRRHPPLPRSPRRVEPSDATDIDKGFYTQQSFSAY